MVIMGIDPGLSGGIAIIEDDGLCCRVFDMPTLSLTRGGKNKREIDAHELARSLYVEMPSHVPGHAFVEQIGAMPGQGVSSLFAMGKGYGVIIGVLAALSIPYTLVSSRKWKKALGVPADKDGARARASQLIPTAAHQWPLKKHDGRAESALLAYYGARELAGDKAA